MRTFLAPRAWLVVVLVSGMGWGCGGGVGDDVDVSGSDTDAGVDADSGSGGRFSATGGQGNVGTGGMPGTSRGKISLMLKKASTL